MLIKRDRIDLDGTVSVHMDCQMQMSRLDYMIWMSLYFLKEEEKEKLLLDGIPLITNGRVVPTAEETEHLKKHSYRLKNFKMFAR
ncbi:MAG: hypothetical protein J6T72_02900 [Alphaproteobacteria bacterium]|nr:hypothetical protein [Alphaproteobacteria bacterium]